MHGAGAFPVPGAVVLLRRVVGRLAERLVIRRLYGRVLDTILATWGLGVILQQAVRLGAGAELRYVKMPDALTRAVPVFGDDVSSYRLFILGLTILLLAVTYLLIFRTAFGMRLRGVVQNPEIARCFGVNTSRLFADLRLWRRARRGGRCPGLAAQERLA